MTTEVVKTDDEQFAEEFGKAVAESQQTPAAKQEAAPEVEKKDAPPADDPTKKVVGEKAAAEAKVEEAAAAAKAAEEKVTAAAKAAEDARRVALTEDQRVAEDAAGEAAAAKKVAEDKARQDAEVRVAAEKRVADEAQRKAAVEEQKKTEDAAAAKAKKDVEELLKPYEYTAEEKKALESFQKEFPTEYAGMEARFKAVEKASQAQAHKVMSSILLRVQEVVAPLAQGYATESQERHFAAVKDAHKDCGELVDLVPAWIEKQPAYLKKAYQEAYDGGTTKEVIDLFDRFKQDTGRTKVIAPTPTPTLKPKVKATEDEVTANTPVGARRATPSPRGAPDPNDYEGAFAEATGTK